MSEHHDIIIIGAGLSGLYSAWKLQTWQLQEKPRDVIVLEARDRTGGRIFSAEFNTNCRFDMGPAWVWPDFQPHLQQLISQLSLTVFKQFTSGELLYEKGSGEIERHNGPSSHKQSCRITGGNQTLIDALESRLNNNSLHLNTQVQSIQQKDLSIQTERNGKLCTYTANKIILALPPRLLLQNIKFDPPFTDEISSEWHNTPTWMSVHCKIIFIYATPFWREQNLSGEVFSHLGPLTEIYDASPATEDYFALTSFVGLNPLQRRNIGEQGLIELSLAQLQRLFGDKSKELLDIKIKDWSMDKHTTTEMDLSRPMIHPQYAENRPRSFWKKSLILAGSEVAREHGGYLEGALESADEAVAILIDR